MTTYAESLHVSLLRLLVETEYETGLSAEYVLSRLPPNVGNKLSTKQVATALNNLVAFGFAAKQEHYGQHQVAKETRYTATVAGREHFAQITFDPG